MKYAAVLLDAHDASISVTEITGETPHDENACIRSKIAADCSLYEVVRLGSNVCMLVDEEGLLKREPIVNPLASILYPGFPPSPIAGNVLIVGLTRNEDGEEIFTDAPSWIMYEVLSALHTFMNELKAAEADSDKNPGAQGKGQENQS